jgi:hypothetical protein
MGLHLPTWGFISFAGAATLLGLVMFWEGQFRGEPIATRAAETSSLWRLVYYVAFGLIAVITAGNVIIGYTVCGASLTCAA